jgi:hypothetical protein
MASLAASRADVASSSSRICGRQCEHNAISHARHFGACRMYPTHHSYAHQVDMYVCTYKQLCTGELDIGDSSGSRLQQQAF